MSSIDRFANVAPSAEPPPSSLRGRRHGEDRLYLFARDPHSLFAAWELSPALHARAEGLARAEGASTRYQIRVERRRDERDEAAVCVALDLPDAVGGEGWYIDLPAAGGECRALLLLLLPSGIAPLLRSRWTAVPPDGPCAEAGEWEIDAAAAEWLDRRFSDARSGPGGSVMSSARRYLGASAPSERRS